VSTNSEKNFHLFGARLLGERNRLALSKPDLASRIGVSTKTVFNWESNASYPDAKQLSMLKDMGFDANFLVFGLEASGKVEEEPTAYQTPARVLAQKIAVLTLSVEDAEIVETLARRLAQN